MDRRWAASALLLAAVLVANPLWLAPHADDTRHVYRVSPAEPRDVRADSAVLVCDGGASERCSAERRAVTEGVAVGRHPTAFGDRPTFVYLASADRYYRTGVRWTDGARTATGRPVPYGSVRDYVALDGARGLPTTRAANVVSTAIETGVVRTRTRVALSERRPDGPVVVAHDGSYLAVRRASVAHPTPFRDALAVPQQYARGGLALVGVGLCLGVVFAVRGSI